MKTSLNKRVLAGIITLIMVSSICLNGFSHKTRAASQDGLTEDGITTYDISDLINQDRLTITEHTDAIGNRWGQPLGTGLSENMSVKMKVDTGTTASGKYSLALCRSTGTNLWDGYGYYFDVELEGKIAFFIGNDWAGQTTDVTIPIGEPYILEYGIVNLTDGTGAVVAKKIFIKINDEEVYSYTDTAMNVACGNQLSFYTTILPLTLEAAGDTVSEVAPTEYDISNFINQNSLTITEHSAANGNEWGQPLGTGLSENMSVKMKVDTGSATSGKYSLGLCKSTGTNLWDGYGYYFDIELDGKIAFFKGNDWAGQKEVTIPTKEPYILEYGIVNIIDVANTVKAKRIFIKINDQEVYSYTDSEMSVTCGDQLSVYTNVLPLTLQTTKVVTSEATPTQYDLSDLINQKSLTIIEHTDALGNRWGQSLGTGLSENMSVKMKVDTGSATSGKYSLGLCKSTGTNLWDGYGYYFDIELDGKIAFFKGNDWAGQKEVTIPTGEPYILEYGIVNIMDGTGAVTAKKIFIKINDVEVYSYTDSEMSVTCGDQLSVYTNVLPLTLQTTNYNPIGEKVPADVTFEDIGITLEKNTVGIATKEFGGNLGQVSTTETGFAFKLKVPEATTESLFVGLYNTTLDGAPWANGYMLDIVATAEKGTLGFKLRNGANHEDILDDIGYLQGLGEDEITIHAWIKESILYIAVNDSICLTHTNNGSITVGKYMSAYNDWSHQATIKTLTEIYTPIGQKVPEDVAFEDIGITLAKNTVGIATKEFGGNLGQVSSKKTGFAFKVKVPQTTTGSLIVGLYNTTLDGAPWANGYMLDITATAEKGTLGFKLRNGANHEDILDDIGYLQALGEDEITIHAWIKDSTLYIAVNDSVCLTHTNNGSITVGKYMSAYNEWSHQATIKTLTEVYDPVGEKVPKNITFEDIGITINKNKIGVSPEGYAHLGKVSSQKTGFAFKVEVSKTISESLHIGLYNTEQANPWRDGYILDIAAGAEKGTTSFTLRKGKDHSALDYMGDLKINEDEITVHAWLKGNTIYVAINGSVRLKHTNDGSIKLGKYMSAYSNWSHQATIKTVTKVYDPVGEKVPKNITFEDIGITLRKNKKVATNKGYVHLGEVSSKETGFAFKVEIPKKITRSLHIGLYNTEQANPWMNGYILDIAAGAEEGTLAFTLRKGKDHSALDYPGDLKIDGNEITVHAWMKGNTTYVAINGSIWLTHTNDGSIILGQFMSAYSDWTDSVTIKTLTEVYDPFGEKVPEDITFEDIGTTLRKNKLTFSTKEYGNLGKVSSTENGFGFKLKVPKETTRSLHIGLYNTEQANPWRDGYILDIAAGTEEGTLSFTLRKGKDHSALDYPGDLKIDGDEITVHVWLKDDTFHVAINGVIWLTHTNEKTIAMGTYMSVYSDWSQSITIETLTKTTELGELYLARYGDPTAMKDVDDNANNNILNEKTSYWPYVAIGVLVVALIGVSVLVFMKRKKK